MFSSAAQRCKPMLLGIGILMVLGMTGDGFQVDSKIGEPALAAQIRQASSQGGNIDEAPEPDDLAERINRAAKNARYNNQGNGQDLTSLEPGTGVSTIACGGDDPAILPVRGHEVIVLGTLRNAQPYLSADRTAIFTEYRFEIEEVFKPSRENLQLVNGHLLIDRPGGVLRLRSGRIITYDFSASGMARPLDVGGRYVLFCQLIHDKRDLLLGRGFELRDGKAFALWERHGYDRPVGELEGGIRSLSQEETFIEAVRNAVKHPGSARYFSALRQ